MVPGPFKLQKKILNSLTKYNKKFWWFYPFARSANYSSIWRNMWKNGKNRPVGCKNKERNLADIGWCNHLWFWHKLFLQTYSWCIWGHITTRVTFYLGGGGGSYIVGNVALFRNEEDSASDFPIPMLML